jgi:hypothetical protein
VPGFSGLNDPHWGNSIASPQRWLNPIPITLGKGRTPGGLWFIGFGVGGSNGDPNTLYFSDGINGETDGLFGAIFPNGP